MGSIFKVNVKHRQTSLEQLHRRVILDTYSVLGLCAYGKNIIFDFYCNDVFHSPLMKSGNSFVSVRSTW